MMKRVGLRRWFVSSTDSTYTHWWVLRLGLHVKYVTQMQDSTTYAAQHQGQHNPSLTLLCFVPLPLPLPLPPFSFSLSIVLVNIRLFFSPFCVPIRNQNVPSYFQPSQYLDSFLHPVRGAVRVSMIFPALHIGKSSQRVLQECLITYIFQDTRIPKGVFQG